MALAGPPTSIQTTHLVDWPISEDSFSVDVFFRYQAPHAAVVRLIPVIAQNIVVARLNIYRRIGSMVHILRKDVVLIERLVVHLNNSAPDFNDVSGHANHALDIGLGWVEGIPKNNNIFPLNLLDAVDEFVDEDSLLVDQFRQH